MRKKNLQYYASYNKILFDAKDVRIFSEMGFFVYFYFLTIWMDEIFLKSWVSLRRGSIVVSGKFLSFACFATSLM